MKIIRYLLILSAMVLTSSVFADLTDYAMKIKFTVSGDFSDVSDFPVLVRLAENSPVKF